MKTGIFGGAFDPIHKGHIYMAQKAMEEYSLDRILACSVRSLAEQD